MVTDGFDESAARGRFEQQIGERAGAPPPHQFEMAEPGPAEELRLHRIGGERTGEGGAHPLARPAIVEPDKIDDDAAGEIAQPDLARDRRRRREIGGERGPLRRAGFRGAAVDIDQHRGTRRLDVDGAAAGERYRRRQRLLEQRVEV